MRQKNADFIIGEGEYFYSILYSYLIHMIAGKPLIPVVHQMQPDMYRKNNAFHSLIYRHIYEKMHDVMIVHNDYNIGEFRSLFGDGIELYSIYNGVDVNSFYSTNIKEFDLVYIGEIGERKNSFIIPDLISRLKYFKSNIKLVIVSHQGEIERLKELIKNKNIDENVIFYDYVTEKRKREILSQSKVMLFPSKYEGFGIVVAEALASGLPVIMFDVPSLRTFNRGVIKVEPYDLDKMIDEIKHILEDDAYREQIGREGRKEAEERLDYSIVAKYMNEQLKKIAYKKWANDSIASLRYEKIH
ncbi:MAG: glycosyltransferase family 4 protein [Caldisphaera sp.]